MRRTDRDIVLVVDDSPETLRLLTDALEAAGMTVLVAREGDLALSIVEKVVPDVVLMDAVMPGTDGFATCRKLKQNRTLAHVPIIFMTGLTDTDNIIKGLEAGGVDYITKPIVPGEMLARIRVHLANARMAHSARAALDVFGRFLLAASHTGRVLWYTPQAARLLGLAFAHFDHEDYVLPPEIQAWLQTAAAAAPGSEPASTSLRGRKSGAGLHLIYIGEIGPDEYLLRLVEGDVEDERMLLRQKLTVTEREAEVLLWIARGKSNRDIAEILDLSPRTVNKHLEQIYAKLGVENRASAAAMAVRTIGVR
jgi:DNA-binding response OmpR family regulator/DNA-binding CsgD family transcriptional regulator